MSKTLSHSAIGETATFDRLRYWQARELHAPARARTVFAYPLAACLQLSDVDAAAVDAAVFEIIAHSFPQTGELAGAAPIERRHLIARLNATTRFSIDVANNLDRLTALEATLVQIFARLGLLNEIVGWQYPLDIRVVHPQAPQSYLTRRDATDYLHCDPWRGEPDDLVNVVIYCEAGDNASQLELFAVEPADLPRFASYTGDERAAEALIEDIKPVMFKHRSGQVIVFDGYLPHRTRRLGDRVRVSLNFSLRRRDPYAVIDERWYRERQAWDKFWFVNSGSQYTFGSRCVSELEHLRLLGNSAATAARRTSLARHFNLDAEASSSE